ncbi:MAG: hypothetical protein M4579_006755 [Chaenotheca gracillima]|nr:MAG: hypothetical protein M4579_006755 [Chaenotheca gracillima]
MAGRPENPRESAEDATPRLPALSGLDEDFTVESLGVSDGFRPQSSTEPSTVQRRISESAADRETNPANHTSKSHHLDESSLPQSTPIAANAHQRTTSALSASSVSDLNSAHYRSMSPISAFSMPHAQSPTQSQSGPTHPYAIYPQGTQLPRTSSIMTNSTIRAPDPAHTNGDGPQHPYALYPQSVLPEGEVAPTNGTTSIPVGFPGMASHYQRRLGPEGEEAADIIGSDGHTEQLPPYTRYPMDNPPKAENPPPPNGLDPVNTQNPVGPSQDSLNSPESRLSSRSMVSDSSGAQLNAAAAPDAERNETLKEKWDEQKARRFCGGKLPMWVLVVCVVLAVTACTVIGGVVGATLARRHHKVTAPAARPSETIPNDSPPSVVTVTKDYSPLPTLPANLPDLPVGNYSMAMPYPSESNASCVDDTEPNAWSCLVAPTSGFLLSVMPQQGTNMNFFQLIQVNASSFPSLGMQPPTMNGPVEFQPVMDKDDPNRGPAYFFELSYNKTVIVPADKMNVEPASKRGLKDAGAAKRHNYNINHAYGYRHSGIDVGDSPWYCMWNNTFLQGFVYLTLNSSGSLNPSTTTVTSTPTATPYATTAPTPQESVRYPHYPRVIKLDEQRNSSAPNYVKPYCQQMKVLNDLQVVPAVDSDGNEIVLHLDEFGSDDEIQESKGPSTTMTPASSHRKRTINSPCHCEWELL